MYSPHVSGSTFTATTTTVTVSRNSQPELAAGQRQQGFFVGLSTTVHTPGSILIPVTYHQQNERGVSSEIGTTQIDPFEALATHQAVTYDYDYHGQSTSSLSLSIESSRSQSSSQSVEDIVPTVRQEQSLNPTDKWIMMSGDEEKPFQCGYEGCGKKYLRKTSLRKHLVSHTRNSKFRCYSGNCAGKVIYDERELTQHMRTKHTFERPYRCELCNKRFKRSDHLTRHMDHVHFIKSKKRSPKRHSVSKSSSATTTAITASTSTMTPGVSQPELAAGQRQQGSFVDLSKTVYKPEPTIIPATYYQRNELGLLSGISVSDLSSSQFDPFEILATHQSVTFEDQNQFQEQLDVFPLPFDELLQPIDDFDLVVSEAPDDVNLSILSNKNDERISNRTTISIPERKSLPPNNDHFRQALTGIKPEAVGITGDPNLPNSQHQAYQRPETDKWIILTGDKTRPFKCGYEGCGRKYSKKGNLQTHFVIHTGDSPYRCYVGECTGKVAFSRPHELTWHIRSEHKLERLHLCEVCGSQFTRPDHLRRHRRQVHSTENEKKSPKRKKK